MIIQYEVYSDKKEDVALVAKYWAKDEHGKFEHKVASLIPYGDITTTSKLTKYINTISKAWYEPFRCKRCEEHIRVWSRTTPLPRHNQTCDHCWQTLENERRYLLQKKAEEAQRRIDLITKENKHLRVDYTSVADDAALLLLALRKAVKPKFLWESFELNDCKGLASTNIDVFMQITTKPSSFGQIKPSAKRRLFYFLGFSR
jgi:hypothetical protein